MFQEAFLGYRLVGTKYQLIEHDGEKVMSDVLQLELAIHDKYLRLRHPATHELIPTLLETYATLQSTYAKLQEETKARAMAEKKVQELERLLQELENKKTKKTP